MRIVKKVWLILLTLAFIVLTILEAPVLLAISLISLMRPKALTSYRDAIRKLNDRIISFLKKDFQSLKRNKELEAKDRSKITVKIDPRPDHLKSLSHEFRLKSDPFPHRNVVIYYESASQPIINEYLHTNYTDIRNKLLKKGIDFIYPSLFRKAKQEDMNELLDYYFPDLSRETLSPEKLTTTFSSFSFYKGLIGIEETAHPCFIRSTGEKDENGYLYRIFYLPGNDTESVDAAVSFYLSVVNHARYVGPQFSLGNRYFNETDPDVLFEKEAYQLSQRLRDEMDKELAKNNTKGALRMLIFLFKRMNQYDIVADGAMKKFISDIQTEGVSKLSPILITSTGKVILNDFGKEVEMTPLQKTVFIFFLMKEDGIMFKDLPGYKNELMTIYSKVSNRSSLDLIKNSISDLVNPYSNSMSEKCSRIKEAFLKCMDERVAKYYYVTGDRNQPKKIMLNRKLVVFEDSVY